jgi:hypothetical protein
MKINGAWTNRKFTPGLTSKQPGTEGPLYEAVSSNHVYVYGTGGNPSQEELAARRAAAASAADYGLVYIFPMNNHYIVINSGLPWWTQAKQTSRQGGFAFISSKPEALKKFQDFVLFRESSDNIITQGRFDNNWNLPVEAVESMSTIGVVQIR